jgi:site-specific recombinase XerC
MPRSGSGASTDIETRLFCLILMWSGARLSEVLALTPNSLELDAEVVSIETLGRRRRGA